VAISSSFANNVLQSSGGFDVFGHISLVAQSSGVLPAQATNYSIILNSDQGVNLQRVAITNISGSLQTTILRHEVNGNEIYSQFLDGHISIADASGSQITVNP